MFILTFNGAPLELLLASAKKSAQRGSIGLAGEQVSLKGLSEFQNKNLEALFNKRGREYGSPLLFCQGVGMEEHFKNMGEH